MKHLCLLFAVFFFAACSKDERYGPWNLKNGQEVEVLVSHRYGALGDQLELLPQGQSAQMNLYSFTDREPGYNYRVKAKMVVPKVPAADGPSYHLEFVDVVSKEKYDGNEPFQIALIQSHVPGGPIITIWKQDGYYYFAPNIMLTYADKQIGTQLEEIWQHNKELHEDYENRITPVMKWRSITATVTHDPKNFGKSYLVSHIEFDE